MRERAKNFQSAAARRRELEFSQSAAARRRDESGESSKVQFSEGAAARRRESESSIFLKALLRGGRRRELKISQSAAAWHGELKKFLVSG